MKKFLVLIAVLSLVAGTAFAADLNEGQTKQVYAQAKGRSVVSDGSVAFRVWYTGGNSPQIGVSCDSVNLYENGVLSSVSFATYPTIQQAVDYINSLSGWDAAVGPDLYGGAIMAPVAGRIPLLMTTTTPGSTKQSPTNVYDDSSTRLRLFAGVEATDGKINRIKQITSKFGVANPAAGIITVLVYDGDTIVWRKDVTATAYNTATDKNASPDTISFVNYTDKGIAGSMGKSLVAVVSTNTALATNYMGTVAGKAADHNISILYDQF